MKRHKLQPERRTFQVRFTDNSRRLVRLTYVGPYYGDAPNEAGAYALEASTDPKARIGKLIPVGALKLPKYAANCFEMTGEDVTF